MLISAKSTYAIRAIVDMARHNGESEYICLSSIATRLNISRKYLESIMTLLAKSGLIDVCKGKCGGYKLNKEIKEYSLYDILIVTEEELKAISCSCINNSGTCEGKDCCSVLETYNELHDLIKEFLKKKTIKDLM